MATPSRTPPKVQRRETNDERKRRKNKEEKKLQRRQEPRSQQQRRKQRALKSRSPVKQQSTRGLGGWLRPRASPKMGSGNRGASLQEKNLTIRFQSKQTTPPSAVNDIVIVYFTKNKQVLTVRSKKSTEPPLSYDDKTPALSTMGKVIQASPNEIVVIYKKPKARFENRMAQGKSSGAGIGTSGGVPLFALLDSNTIDPEGKILDTKHPGNVGAHVQVYFDRKTGDYKEKTTSAYDYVGFGKIMKKTEFSKQPEYNSKGVMIKEGTVLTTGKILVVPPTVKLMIYRSAKDRKVGDKKGVYVGGNPPPEKKPGEKGNNKSPPKFVDPTGARPEPYPGATRLDGTIIEAQKTSSGETLYTVSYVEPRKTTSGQYIPRYDIFNNAGMLKTDPRYIQAMTAEKRLAIAQEKPPICSTRLDFSTRDNCFAKHIDSRVIPAMKDRKSVV